MITASHNPADENGVKVIRSDGGLLLERQLDTPHHIQGEYFADLLQEALQPPSHDHSATNDGTCLQPEATSIDREIARLNWLFERLRARMLGHSVRNQGMKTLEVKVGLRNDSGGLVIIGYDNRSSSVRLAEIARRVVLEATKSVGVRELGLTTTPFAQYAVWATQNGQRSSFAGYVRERLVQGYLDLCRALLLDPEVVSPDAYDQRTVLQVDCAHGTGSVTLDEVASSLDLPFRIVNHHRESQAVNQECGAEYVHRYARPGCGGGMQAPGQRMAALDGDADRLVYYGTLGIDEDVTDESRLQHTSISVYDGDWTAFVLVTLLYRCRSYFIEDQRSETDALDAQLPKHLTMGCALTAYSSGIYRERIQSVCQGRVLLVPTGAQHGRDMVERHFDLAVYAEPNGHVGCYIAPLVLHRLRKLLNEYSGALSRRAEYAARCLVAIARLGNPTGSDGVSLLLTIEALLRTEPATHFLRRIGTLSPPQRTAVVNLQLAEEELVSEDLRLASRQAAVSWRFCADETRILEPYWAQTDIIDESLRWAHSKYPDWIQRGSLSAFVRPSRTEPIWRIRVEAASEATPLTQADVQVAEQVAAFIRKRLVAAFQRVSGTTKPQTYSERGLQRRTVPIHDTMTLAAFEAAAAERHGNPQLLLPPDWSKQLQSSRVVGIVLAAGQGSRFRAAYPKVVHSFCGKPMVRRVLDTLTMLRIPTLVVTHDSTENAVVNALFPLSYGMVRQREPLGTGHALYTALHYYLRDFHGDVLVLYGDNPGVDATLLEPLLALRANIRVGPATQDCLSRHFGVILSGSYTSKDAGTYGRVLRDDQSGALKSIVEYREARKRPDEAAILAVREFYSGIMVADRVACLELLGQCRAHRLNSLNNDSSGGMEERFEFYATDVIQMAISQGFRVNVHCVPESSGLLWRLEGVNTVAELEALELEASSSASHETPGMSSSGGV
ncbi:hypothetical protein CCYA_CCYA12G3272 [Cyanidiococcus yangmingshanensis]|nr:hypothetical protein CCYA_CCYA12G3272 [Cyanidiococcus yangmingshanensis]